MIIFKIKNTTKPKKKKTEDRMANRISDLT